jgi:hypothetical protein
MSFLGKNSLVKKGSVRWGVAKVWGKVFTNFHAVDIKWHSTMRD